MTPLKIIVAHNSYRNRGGEDAVVDDEVALLRSHGHGVTEYRQDNARISGIGNFDLLQRTIWSRAAAAQLRALVARTRADVVHVHNTFPLISPAVYWAAGDAGVPVVQTLHNFRLLCAQAMFLREGAVCEDCIGRLPWRGVMRRCYRDSAAQSATLVSMLAVHRALGTYRRKVSRYIALSEFSRRKLIEGGLPAERIVVKPNFVERQPTESGERSGCLYVGRLSPEKGLMVLATALEEVGNVMCDVIGSGPQEAQLTGIPQMRMLGQQPAAAVLEAMRRAAFLVMPSICYEQFPRTLVEAYACGLPVIASRLGPLAELVEHGRTGLLFEPGSGADLARQIRYASTHREEMRNMGENARAEYTARYTPQRNHEQLMEVYSAAIESH
jgi:glycosyltransferase involved in cell wall biosynthesis